MIIDGFNKLTLLDYPGHVACIIFTRGCNFKCEYCHNSGFIENDKRPGLFSEEEVLEYLKERKKTLEGIVISGGEPTIQKDLDKFIRKVKELGYKVKLDTNGSNPVILKRLLDENLLDYVAMDIKNTLDDYGKVSFVKTKKESLKESINLLKKSKIDYEFRTTIFKEIHDINKIKDILKLVGNSKYYIQNFNLSENVKNKFLHGFSKEELKEIKERLNNYPNVEIRGL